MQRHYFVAKMPDEPGALHRAAEIVKRHGGNIDRIQYDKRIDPYTVFFEARCSEEEYLAMRAELEAIGYLQGQIITPSFLKFQVVLPNRSGALFDTQQGSLSQTQTAWSGKARPAATACWRN